MRAEPTGGSSLARGAAIITVATAVSRVTGFLRVVVVAAVMGTTFLANTYQTANTVPNVLFELLAAGVLTSVFVPTFMEYLVRGDRRQGWDAANALGSVALVALIVLAGLVALAAPALMWIFTLGVTDDALRQQEIRLGSTFLRLFAPQLVFYGAGMIMTGALHAHRRFAMAAAAPIFNNVVVIATYLVFGALRGDQTPTVAGISPGETLLLGVGTTMGVVAMTLVLLPPLRSIGWRFRIRFDPRHPAVAKATRLGVWALGYAGGYQAGLIVVLILANRVEGGVAAYQWAYTFFYVPHALFAAPIFHVLFPAMSEHAARGEEEGLLERLRDGLSMLAFILIPLAAAMFVTADLVSRLTLQYGVMTETGAALVGRVLAAFALGLPGYSAFLVLTRAFYARSDTKTPALVNAAAIVIASVIGVMLFTTLPDGLRVAGLGLGHSVAFVVGTVALARLLGRAGSTVGSTALFASLARTAILAGASLATMVPARWALPSASRADALVAFAVTVAVGAATYVGGMAWLGAPELRRVRALLPRGRHRP